MDIRVWLEQRPELQFDPRFLDHYVHYLTVQEHLQYLQQFRSADDASSARSFTISASFSASFYSDTGAETPIETPSLQAEDSLWSDVQTVTTATGSLQQGETPTHEHQSLRPVASQQSELEVQKAYRRYLSTS